ncbi:MAG: AIPR protein [Methylobacter sp.]|nr:MAG: AIPR protein [Methylobacter sp.]
MQYETLLRILDQIRMETSQQANPRYFPVSNEIEKLNQARSRAYIHLYLKVMFGLTDFNLRERVITDGSYDGGIDGYYIDTEVKIIHIIQSKFRTTAKNFEAKEILLEELLAMQLDRILNGETVDEAGNAYNGKILQLQREVSSLPDVARYSYRVVVLANLKGVSPQGLRQLTGGFTAEVFDFEKTYSQLVFPVLTGTYFTANDITIPIDLSNKNAGSKISYNVITQYGNCEITVLFVPTLEIAKLMHKYKNAILKYNPRSYLEFDGQSVNNAIRATILQSESNEFALFNNGITMLSEETNINEKIGQKNKAQLQVKNPQIINGGQTSFTLSRIYAEDPSQAEAKFADKEVLLKIITLLDGNANKSKLKLIDEISNATNKQTTVINADRFANESFHVQVQKLMFDYYGFLYERKRGELSDGVRNGYLKSSDIVERNHFWRLFYTANGKINLGFQKKLFQRNEFNDVNLNDRSSFDRLFLAIHVFRRLKKGLSHEMRVEKDIYGKVYAYIQLFHQQGLIIDDPSIDSNLSILEQKWIGFIDIQRNLPRRHSQAAFIDKETGEAKSSFSDKKYFRSPYFEKDLVSYFGGNTVETV